MKKIKVYLQYPWSFPDSPYYKYLIQNPPKNIEYFNVKKQKGVITSFKKFAFMNKIKNILRKILEIVKIPNITKTKKGNYDLIHCAHCLSLNKKPWIVDAEKYWNFSPSYNIAHSKKGKEKIKRFLKNSYCKKIIPWTEAAKKSITDALKDKEIEKKIEVVYPAIPLPKIKRKKKKEKIILLFVGRYFHSKGGLQALKVMDILTKKYKEVRAIFVSETPEYIKKKYSANRKIKFYGLMSQDKLYKIYSKSDIFIYPGYSDSFGFANLEAMSFGLVVLGVNRFARKEIISDNKTGFLIKIPEISYKPNILKGIKDGIPIIPNEEEVIQEFVKKASLIIKNKNLREKMSKAAIREIKSGKFSIKQRNKKLKRIYEEALK